MIIILLSLSIISMVICYLVSKRKAASTSYWLKAGLFFGPLAIPFVFFSKAEVDEEEKFHN